MTTQYPPGVYRSLAEADYRAAPAVANSDLKLMRRSPAHFYAARLDPDREPEVDTPDKIAGRALHCAILEPDDFENRYIYVPEDAPRDLRQHRNAKDPSQSTKDSIAWWDDFTNCAEGKTILTKRVATQVRKAGAKIAAHPEVRGWLALPGLSEESVFAIDPETGEPVKCRTDRRIITQDGMHVVIDLKTTTDARDQAFERTAYQFGYFAGAAFYSDVPAWAGLPPVDLYLLLAFERDNPGAGVAVYEIAADEIARGRREYRPALDLYHHCKTMGEWPGYDSAVRRLLYPGWAKEAV